MELPITPLTIASSALFGIISAYFAYRQGRNPYVWFFIGLFFGMLGCFALLFSKRTKKILKPSEKNPLDDLPSLSISEPTNKLWYYLDHTHQQIGPISHNALVSNFQEKKISLSTYVWNEDMTEWKTLEQLYQKII